MQTTLAFAPAPDDLDEDLFGVPVIFWTPPAPEGEDDGDDRETAAA